MLLERECSECVNVIRKIKRQLNKREKNYLFSRALWKQSTSQWERAIDSICLTSQREHAHKILAAHIQCDVDNYDKFWNNIILKKIFLRDLD